MADENTGNGGDQSNNADPLANVKGEFNRKLGNLEQKVGSLEETNRALLNQLKAMSAPAPVAAASTSDEDAEIENSWFNEPKVAAAKLTNKITKLVTTQIADATQNQQRHTSTISELVDEFPELRKADHPMTKRAIEIFNGLSASDKTNPISYKAAVSQAALEMAVAPMSKRPDNEYEESDDFTLNGSGASGVRNDARRSKRSNAGISKATADFAKLVGVNIDDEKVKERIKTKHGRNNYRSYK